MNLILLSIRKIINIPKRFRIKFYRIWNRFLFKIKGVLYGNNLNVTSSIYLQIGDKSKITIGNNFKFTSGECINPLCRNIKGCIVTESNSSIKIGNNVGISSSCIWSHSEIIIKDRVNIGGDCIIMDSDAHSLNYMDRRIPSTDKANKINLPIKIEEDVLIGTRCIILKGVTIGARSVIGSGSIVTKSIPSDCIAGGNPCKIIKTLNEE